MTEIIITECPCTLWQLVLITFLQKNTKILVNQWFVKNPFSVVIDVKSKLYDKFYDIIALNSCPFSKKRWQKFYFLQSEPSHTTCCVQIYCTMSNRDQAMILAAICSGFRCMLTHGHPKPGRVFFEEYQIDTKRGKMQNA